MSAARLSRLMGKDQGVISRILSGERNASPETLEAIAHALRVPTELVLRAAGIYGPGRGVIARLRAGAYRAIGDGRTATSRIHVDDLVTAIIAAGDHAAPAEVYNVADDDPGPTRELVAAVVAGFGLPWPPAIAISGVAPEVAAMVTADRRISNARLKAHLGVRLRYPSWRTALAEDLA